MGRVETVVGRAETSEDFANCWNVRTSYTELVGTCRLLDSGSVAVPYNIKDQLKSVPEDPKTSISQESGFLKPKMFRLDQEFNGKLRTTEA